MTDRDPTLENQTIERCCDLVLKGGVTSGVIYPSAIARIAERFHFVGIGGSSAGAIGACLAAAAEYRRRHGDGSAGFSRLEKTAVELAGEGRLASLFRPDRSTRRLFERLFPAKKAGDEDEDESSSASRPGILKRLVGRVRRVGGGAVRGVKTWAGLQLAVLFRNRLLRPVVENGYGMCSGMGHGNRSADEPTPPLTPWLTDLIDEIAGRPTDGPPLTFGDLRDAPLPESDTLRELLATTSHSINLRAMTTCLTFGQPYALPFDGVETFAFDEAEWRRLFPRRVVDHMVAASTRLDESSVDWGSGRHQLATGDALPVVVAARMSLSFPGLFSMVPLWAMDYHAQPKTLRRVWFSDGGITSNLPIQLFDGLFPRWPTLAINLMATDADDRPWRSSVDPEELVYMIRRQQDGSQPLFASFDESGDTPIAQLGRFASGILSSAKDWHDNSFLRLTGYRDRVGEVWQRSNEGGLNLDMDDEVIEALIERGDLIGRRLRDRFASPSMPGREPDWETHRWVRFRSSFAGLAEMLRKLERGLTSAHPDDRSWDDLVGDPPSHALRSRKQAEQIRETATKLLQLIEEMPRHEREHDPTYPFDGGPRPPIEIGPKAPI